MPPRRRRPVPIGDLLGELLPPAAAGRLLAVSRVWPGCVGPAIARETSCARLAADGALLVHCSSAIWAAELELLAPRLVTALREALGEVAPTGLRFRVGPLPSRPPEDPAPHREARAAPAALAAATALSAPIRDDDLRRTAERVIAGALSARPPLG